MNLSYQVFGQDLGTAPIILVNHALTGNSYVAGKDGWWRDIVGDEKAINTKTIPFYPLIFLVMVLMEF